MGEWNTKVEKIRTVSIKARLVGVLIWGEELEMMGADRADRKALGQAMMNRWTVLFLILKLGLTVVHLLRCRLVTWVE